MSELLEDVRLCHSSTMVMKKWSIESANLPVVSIRTLSEYLIVDPFSSQIFPREIFTLF